MLFLGIDPGVSGGLAALSEDGRVLSVRKMPETDQDLISWFLMFDQGPRIRGEPVNCPLVRAVIERVNPGVFGRPGAKMGVVSAFTFGGGYRALQMVTACMAIPFDLVNAAQWQLALSCRSKGDKNVTKRRAQQLFPNEKVTHAIADALLIAEYNRRMNVVQRHLAEAAHVKGLFDGEETRTAEGLEDEEDRSGEGATQAAAEGAAGDGRPRHQRDRKRRAPLR